MIDPYFLQLPIYRCPIEKHSKEMGIGDANYIKKIEKLGGYNIEEIKEIAPDSYRNITTFFDQNRWYPWRFNEVIGWVGLYIYGGQLRGTLYFIDRKRIDKGIYKKKFLWIGKLFESDIPRRSTNKEIFDFVKSTVIHAVTSDKRLKKFYLDLEQLETIGRFVDWLELTEKLISFMLPEETEQKTNNSSIL